MLCKILALLAIVGLVSAQWEPHFAPGRHSMVHLFEWTWNDIAEECERFLGPYGYGGVQVTRQFQKIIFRKNSVSN